MTPTNEKKSPVEANEVEVETGPDGWTIKGGHIVGRIGPGERLQNFPGERIVDQDPSDSTLVDPT